MTDWNRYPKTSIRLGPDLKDRIREAAEAEGETVSRFIRRTLQEAMTEDEAVEATATQ